MKNLLYLAFLGIVFTSCQKEEFEVDRNYQFEMTGRTTQDINGYYHVKIKWGVLVIIYRGKNYWDENNSKKNIFN